MAVDKDGGKKKFIQFLEQCYPLAQDGLMAHIHSTNPMLKKIASRADFYLPFRPLAPTILKAKQTILSDCNRLSTREGLFNLIAFRGVFYGSEFARERLCWFNSYEEWLEFKRNSNKEESYFVTKTAYGTSQKYRHTDNLKMYWDNAGKWDQFLLDNPNRDIPTLHNFFLLNFYNIGDLSALLIIGDLQESGFLPMVDAHVMGKLVAKVGKGAKDALKCLGLTNQHSDENDIANAFVELHQHAMEALNQEKQTKMVYNVITLEHGLCKYKRLLGMNQPKHSILPLN